MAEPTTPSAPSAPSRRSLVAAAVLWTVVMVVVGLASGCYGRNCEGETVVYGRAVGEGRLVGPDEWESSPIDGRWLDFPKQRVWIFELNALGDRAPFSIIPYVSAQADPLHDEGGQFAIAGGNLAEIFGAQRGRVGIKNGTCADYFLRVVVEAPPLPPGSPAADAGANAGGDAEAGP